MPTYFMFGLYLVGMVLVGLIWYKKSDDVETYVLGGRGLGSWVTAMSAQATSPTPPAYTSPCTRATTGTGQL